MNGTPSRSARERAVSEEAFVPFPVPDFYRGLLDARFLEEVQAMQNDLPKNRDLDEKIEEWQGKYREANLAGDAGKSKEASRNVGALGNARVFHPDRAWASGRADYILANPDVLRNGEVRESAEDARVTFRNGLRVIGSKIMDYAERNREMINLAGKEDPATHYTFDDTIVDIGKINRDSDPDKVERMLNRILMDLPITDRAARAIRFGGADRNSLRGRPSSYGGVAEVYGVVKGAHALANEMDNMERLFGYISSGGDIRNLGWRPSGRKVLDFKV